MEERGEERREKKSGLTPNRLARSCVKTIQAAAATITSTTRTMKKVPTGLTIFGRECGLQSDPDCVCF